MQIDLMAKVTMVTGKPIMHEDKDATLRDIILTALLNAPLSGEKRGEEMYARHKLARRVEEAEESDIDLQAKDITKIKDLIAAVYNTPVAGPAWDLLEPEPKPEPKPKPKGSS